MKKQSGKKTTRKTRSRGWTLAAIVASVAILAFVVGSIGSSRAAKAQQASGQEQLQTQDGDATVEFANQKIKIDAQTGRLRKPTVEEAKALVETVTGLTNRSSQGLKVERGQNGISKVDLQGRFQTVVLAKPNPDGTNEIRCVTSKEEAAEFLGIDLAKLPVKKQ